MALNSTVSAEGFALTDEERRRVDRRLAALEKRLVKHPEPKAVLRLVAYPGPRRIEADLRVQLGPLGNHLISHQQAETPDLAARLAVADVARQLERQHAAQRGEPSFGVPSRRLPRQLRPQPLERAEGEASGELESS